MATRAQARQAFSIVNGGQDLPPIPSNSGSDCGAIEFSRDDVESLLNEKLKKNLNYRVRLQWIFQLLVLSYKRFMLDLCCRRRMKK